MTKTFIKDKFRKWLLHDSFIRNMLKDANGCTLLTVTNWVINNSPKLTQKDNLKIISDYYEVKEDDLIIEEKINQHIL